MKFAAHMLLAALILGAWAMAPDSLRQAGAQEAEDDDERFRARFNRIDTNLDDVVGSFEYTVYRISTFNALDSDRDGALSLPEFRDQGRTPSERRAKRRTKTYERADRDERGQIEREEWDGYANRRFQRMDTDEIREESFEEFIVYVN